MPDLKYVKPIPISIKNHPTLNERWVQDRIAEDPTLLGLGDLILKDKERIQPSAGRLDLLFQDLDTNHRYEVEVQLGKTDESHIIRTIEYWDIERKRYPQYDHTAVLVAEDITSRFLNVISLFNGFIPLIVIKMQAFVSGDNVYLVFTTVISQSTLGLEEEGPVEPADRAYWEQRASKGTVALAEDLLRIMSEWDPSLSLKYNKFYIGLAKGGQPDNFVVMKPKRSWIRIELKLDRSDDVQTSLDEAGLDLMDYDTNEGRYKIRLTSEDVVQHKDLLGKLMRASYDQYG